MIDRMSLARQAECVRTGVLSSVDLVNHYLAAIRQFNPAINAIIQMPDEAELLRQAAEADADVVRGKPLGPLHGVPITLKDVLHVRGFRLSRGVEQFLGGVSEQDATTVRRLREAGAIFFGLTNVPELCMSFETDNLIYGRTNNPHDVRRTPGGSSGGEAAAIAAGLSPAGLASDAGGSVRLPAHFSGICGLKLTQGRVPLTPGARWATLRGGIRGQSTGALRVLPAGPGRLRACDSPGRLQSFRMGHARHPATGHRALWRGVLARLP